MSWIDMPGAEVRKGEDMREAYRGLVFELVGDGQKQEEEIARLRALLTLFEVNTRFPPVSKTLVSKVLGEIPVAFAYFAIGYAVGSLMTAMLEVLW